MLLPLAVQADQFEGWVTFDVRKHDKDYSIEAYYRGYETNTINLFINGVEVSNPCTVARANVDQVITAKAVVSYSGMEPLVAEEEITIIRLEDLEGELDLSFTGYATSSNLSTDGYKNLFDKDRDTQWRVQYAFGWRTIYVDFRGDQAFIPTGYVMTTGSDTKSHPNRNPKTWKIYGKSSLDTDEEWEVLADVADGPAEGLGSESRTGYRFNINPTKKYQFFRFEVLDVCGSDSDGYTFQLTELRMTGKAGQHGDVDGNGAVNGNDLNTLINIILGKDNADNYDGRANVDGAAGVNGADINSLINILLGKN